MKKLKRDIYLAVALLIFQLIMVATDPSVIKEECEDIGFMIGYFILAIIAIPTIIIDLIKIKKLKKEEIKNSQDI